MIAVLDGQQRLTALNIALRGKYTEKLPKLRWNNPAAFVQKQLHLCLLHSNDDAAPDEPMYEFSFKTDDDVALDIASAAHFWLKLSDVLKFDPDSLDHEKPLREAGIDANPIARTAAYKLTQLVHKQPVIAYYLETKNDLDKVLNIFIRVNRGGTKLSYSDLLMSVATAHWKDRDAREEVHDLVDQLNRVGEGFSFGRDRVLKASLVLSDLTDIRLKAGNMLDNMLTVEANWDAIERSLLLAARLLAHFGLSRDSLTAENVVIPVAYYVQHRNLNENYLTSPKSRSDREAVRLWVIRSLLRAGFWTGAVDPILIETRRVIKESGSKSFPLEKIEQALEERNKSLRFSEGEIEELLRTPYKSPRCVPLLTLLYGDAVRRNAFHTDHVFPRAKLRQRQIERALSEGGRS
ncbi:MAG: GmrSD restriction endonuclease domain-containing protein, partial [Acidimicrobiia bacterium]